MLPVGKDNRVFIRSQRFVARSLPWLFCIVHRCHGCDFEGFNRIAADDDFDLVLSPPAQTPRREAMALQVETWLVEHPQVWELDGEEAG